MYDRSQATAYLQALGDGPFVFQTFTDNKALKKKFLKNRLGKASIKNPSSFYY